MYFVRCKTEREIYLLFLLNDKNKQNNLLYENRLFLFVLRADHFLTLNLMVSTDGVQIEASIVLVLSRNNLKPLRNRSSVLSSTILILSDSHSVSYCWSLWTVVSFVTCKGKGQMNVLSTSALQIKNNAMQVILKRMFIM